MAFSRSSHGVHGVLTAFPTYGMSKAFLRRVVYLTAFPWRLQGVVTALSRRSWRSRGASTASYGVLMIKALKKMNKKICKLYHKRKQTTIQMGCTYMNSSTIFFQYVCFPFSHHFPSSPLTSHAVFLKANVQMSETLFLFCLQSVRAMLERRGSAVRTPWKRSANAKSAAQTL